MKNANFIRQMTDEQLVNLLVWQEAIPDCSEGCKYCEPGCAIDCTDKRKEQAVRKWLKREVTQ